MWEFGGELTKLDVFSWTILRRTQGGQVNDAAPAGLEDGMQCSPLRELPLIIGLGLAMAACGDRSAPLPTSPGAQQVAETPSGTVAIQPPFDPSEGIGYAESVGVPPAGFKTVVRVKPRPGSDGVIRGETPFTVVFDLCDSTADAGKTLFYLYDWDFNHRADLVGTGTACRQEHTYRVQPQAQKGDEIIRTNLCVVNGNPRAHDSSTFFACRAYTIAVPIPRLAPAGFAHHTGYGQTWFNGVPTGTFDLSQATLSCQEYINAVAPGVDSCNTTGCGCGNGSLCTFNTAPVGVRRVWFYNGPFAGQTTNDACSTGLAWD
jgi:hypothetical protein